MAMPGGRVGRGLDGGICGMASGRADNRECTERDDDERDLKPVRGP